MEEKIGTGNKEGGWEGKKIKRVGDTNNLPLPITTRKEEDARLTEAELNRRTHHPYLGVGVWSSLHVNLMYS